VITYIVCARKDRDGRIYDIDVWNTYPTWLDAGKAFRSFPASLKLKLERRVMLERWTGAVTMKIRTTNSRQQTNKSGIDRMRKFLSMVTWQSDRPEGSQLIASDDEIKTFLWPEGEVKRA
jgi:hypothetical protein